MAIYHLSVKTISRSAGRSATAAAAYRAGANITDERTGEIHDYTRKGGVESAELVLPDGAPEWAADRGQLWNAAEQAEKRKNSTVAREFEVALPAELCAEDRKQLAHDFARELVERYRLVADVAIHAPGREGDNRNHHAHILCTTRSLEADGFGAKTRELDDLKTGAVKEWRERWADLTNAALERAGVAERIDHRSNAERGIEAAPSQHLGPAATAIERRTGEPSRKREDFAQGVAERLAQAKEAGELARAAEQTGRSIIDLSGDLSAALADRERRQIEQERAEARALIDARRAEREQAERQRIERMSAHEVAAEIRRLNPDSPDVIVSRMPDVIEARAQVEAQRKAADEAAARADLAAQRAGEWREAHPIRARLYDAGIRDFAELAKCERVGTESRERAEVLRQGLPERTGQAEALAEQRRREVEASQREARAEVAKLAALHIQKVSQEQQEARSQAKAERVVTAVLLLVVRCQNGSEEGEPVLRKLPEGLRQVVEHVRQQSDSDGSNERMHRVLMQTFRERPQDGELLANAIERAQAKEPQRVQEQAQEPGRGRRAERDDDLSM